MNLIDRVKQHITLKRGFNDGVRAFRAGKPLAPNYPPERHSRAPGFMKGWLAADEVKRAGW